MIVHKVNVRNPEKFGFFQPAKRLRINPEEYVDSKVAAKALGTEPETLHALVDAGHIEADEDDEDESTRWFSGAALKQFIAEKLVPTEVELTEVEAPPVEGTPTPPEEQKRPKAKNPTPDAELKPEQEAAVEAVAEEVEGWPLVADCPSCGSRFGVAADVLRVRCPHCRAVLDVDQESEKPERGNPFKIFSFGRSAATKRK